MPGIPVERPLIPYVQGQTLGQLLRLSADHRAEAVQRQGELSAQLWSGLGRDISSAITGYAKEKQEAPIRAQEQQIRDLQLRQANQADLDQRRQQGITSAMDAALKASMVTDPSTGATIYDRNKLHASMADVGVPETELAKYGPLLDQSDKAVAAVHAARGEALKHSAALIEMAGNDPAVFKSEIQRGIKNNLFTAEDAQPYLDAAEKDPTHIGRITGSILGRDPNAGQFTLEPGAVRVGPDGKVIASNPKPETKPNSQESVFSLPGVGTVKGDYLPGTNGQPGRYFYNGQDVTGKVKDKPTAAQGNGAGTNDVKETIAGMKEGTIPPQMPGRASKDYTAIMAEAHRQGYDLASAVTDWAATQKHIATMNGSQQLRLNQSVNALPEMLDAVEALASKWKGGRFPILNKANLAAAKNGVYGEDVASVARQLDSQIADVTADLGNVYMGGNSPTDHALELAGKSLSGDWSEKVLKDMVTLARNNVQIRQNSIRHTGVAGASANNPYGSQPPAAAPAGQIIVTAPDGSTHPFATQAQADEFKRLAGMK